MNDLSQFREVWFCDFEYRAPDGERPQPVCMVAREMRTGRLIRHWQDELEAADEPPFDVGANSLFVAFYASAELSCFLALGWPMPDRTLDLFAEFRNRTNGLPTPCGAGLLGALTYFGLDAMAGNEKDAMRELAQRGGPWDATERDALLDYCQSDVDALARLLPVMSSKIDLPYALLRGRYMAAAAQIEWNGVPIDVALFERLRRHWLRISQQLIARIDKDFGVFENGSFRRQKFENWLIQAGIPWPRLISGALDLSDDTFREMARAQPTVAPLRELRHTLSELRLFDLAVGSDGRNRCLLSAFRARTGRNQPSNAKSIFGPSVWIRSLIRPEPGRALAYIDYEQQEFAIAAKLSNDPAMIEAYASGDPYLAFAKQAGAVPADATKQSHSAERDQFKQCSLAVQYGMGAKSLAHRIGQSEAHAHQLLRLHRQTYPHYWRWSEAAVDQGMLKGRLWTVFNWQIQVGTDANPRSLANFPCQANGAEMLRLACCLLAEAGIMVCAPVHDAVLIEGPAEGFQAVVAKAQGLMEEASRIVLDGFTVRTDAKCILPCERFSDPRGKKMFGAVMDIIAELEAAETASGSADA